MRYELKVNRSELFEGLEVLRKTVKKLKQNVDAVLTYRNGMLEVYLNGVEVKASAEGSLPGMTRIPSTQAIKLSKVLPNDDPLTIALEGERLYIGSMSLPCIWHNAEPNPIELEIDPPITTLLGVKMKYSEDDIFKSGLSKAVSEAEAQRIMLTRRAANVLEPLGVRQADLERLIEETLRRINKV
jgi:hypothetical protein